MPIYVDIAVFIAVAVCAFMAGYYRGKATAFREAREMLRAPSEILRRLK